ncbi:MAG: preprotein translocase subunit SecG [Candidatus Omnitrophica bacterium]|nr:preprotein translocase subunit SecG [Candidatus Omnitrophota bacterium]
MTILLIVLHIIVCLVLVLVILLQAGRGQGMGGTSLGFGGSVQTLFGTKAGDFLTKATSVSAIVFLITCISLDIIEARKARSIIQAPGEKAVSKEDIAKIKEALEKLKLEAAQQKTQNPAAAPATTAVSSAAAPTTTQAPPAAAPIATPETSKPQAK